MHASSRLPAHNRDDGHRTGNVAGPPAATSAPFLAWHLRVGGSAADDLQRARRAVADLARLGAMGATVDDVVLAVHEVLATALRHGGAPTEITAWFDDTGFSCEVDERDRPEDLSARATPPSPVPDGERGLWLAGRLCDRIEREHRQQRTVIRLHRTRPRAAA